MTITKEETIFATIYKLRNSGKISREYYKVLHKLLRDGKITEVETRLQHIR